MDKLSRNIFVLFVLLLFKFYGPVVADVHVLAHYKFGHTGQVSFAAGDEVIHDVSGNGNDLKRAGDPLFIADAPSNEDSPGRGSILFDGDGDWYQKEGALFGVSDPFLMEVWVCATEQDNPGLHGIVANGDGAIGYVLAQSGNKWIVFVGGVGVFDMSDVVPKKWTHLAIVHDGSSWDCYVDGQKVGGFNPSLAVADTFTVGDFGRGVEPFKGKIHEVRIATFKAGEFDVLTDLIMDQKVIEEREKFKDKQWEQIVSQLTTRQYGVRLVKEIDVGQASLDWLVKPVNKPVEFGVIQDKNGDSFTLILNNSLATRTFYISRAGGNIATISLRNMSNEAEYVRAVKPEARVMINGVWYEVGGLKGQCENSYLIPQWLSGLRASPNAFIFTGMTTDTPKARYDWQPKFNAVTTDWPPKGLTVSMHYRAAENAPESLKDVSISIHYEMYEGLPVIAKWLTVHNTSKNEIDIDKIETEILAVPQDQVKRLHVESDYSFHLVNHFVDDCHAYNRESIKYDGVPNYLAGQTTTRWLADSEYTSWASFTSYEDKLVGHNFKNLLISTLPMGPDETVMQGGTFKSMVTFELLQDSDDVERQSLGIRKFYRKIAPQITENLLTAACPSHDPALLKKLIDQMAECGFERLDITCWPGISHDNLDPIYVKKWEDVAAYAKENGIITGGYELMVASQGRGVQWDCIDPKTGKCGTSFGQSVCMASEWKDVYFPEMWEFVDKTGFGSINVDGPYHGCACGSKVHKYHKGLEDSQWQQWKVQVDYFRELQNRNMYAPAPDWYFLVGQASTGMGYREASANLPRELQLLLYRQYIYDGTWFKTPTMGWMNVGLIGVYNDDPRAMLEPLEDNLKWYEKHLVQMLGAGVQMSLRCNRLYDTENTKKMILKWVGWYKKHRDILISDVIHVRRPNGRDIDCLMHINPVLKEKALAVLFNPTPRKINKEIELPLYYAGMENTARISINDGAWVSYRLDRNYRVRIPVVMEPESFTWLVAEE